MELAEGQMKEGLEVELGSTRRVCTADVIEEARVLVGEG